MAIVTQTINVDLRPHYNRRNQSMVYCSQYDNDLRNIVLNIANEGEPVDVSTYTIYIEGTKPDKHGFSYELTSIGGSVSNNVITVPLQTQMTAVAGLTNAEVVLYSNDERIGSANFILNVEKAGLAEDVDISETDIPAYVDGAQHAAAEATQAKDDAVSAKDTAVEAAETAQQAKDSIPADYTELSDSVLDLKNALSVDEQRLESLDGFLYLDESLWRIGNIAISASGWQYNDMNSRVSTKQGVTYALKSGDVIGLRDYSDARFYIGYRRADGTYGLGGWYRQDYTVVEDGDYVINTSNETDRNLNGDMYSLFGLIFIKRSNESLVHDVDTFNDVFTNNLKVLGTNKFDKSANGSHSATNNQITGLSIANGESFTVYVKRTLTNWIYCYGYDSANNSVLLFDTNKAEGYFTVTATQNITKIGITVPTSADADSVRFTAFGATSPVTEIIPLYDGLSDTYAVAKKYAFIKGIAHRGWSEAPENTGVAFKQAKLNGFDYVETDVRFTSDGVPVLLHDASINRTARNADGTTISDTINISDITYAQALTYDFGIYKGNKYAGTRIMSLADFAALCKNLGLNAYIELVAGEAYTQSKVQTVYDTIKINGLPVERVTFISGNVTYLSYVHTISNKARLGYVTNGLTADSVTALNNLKSQNEVFIDENYAVITTERVNICANSDMPLEAWNITTAAQILALHNYVTGVTSDGVNASKVVFENSI